MANKDLFRSERGPLVPAADSVNNAGGKAYARSAKEALAQYVCTGCLNGTYYTSAKTQLDEVSKLLAQVEPEFVGKLAVYAHEKSLMKDLPALLVAYLASDKVDRSSLSVLRRVFPRVITNGNMMRNFFQMIRAATFGRKSFGTTPRALMRDWFENNSASWIFSQSIGSNPSLCDVIRLIRPKPNTPEKAALLAYLLSAEVVDDPEKGKVLARKFLDKKDNQVKYAALQPYDNLPSIVKEFEDWKKDKTLPVPAINFRFLDNEKLTTEQWADIASKANWTTTVKNLNAYAKHGVYGVEGMTDMIADRIRNEELVRKAKVFPYQIMMAFLATESNDSLPVKVRNALQDAMEIACQNVPVLGKVKVFPDVSGSMRNAVTGNRGSATSKVRCVDVAALFSVALLRSNPDAEIIPFEQGVVRLSLNSRDSIMTNASKLAAVGGGGTNCSAPLALLNSRNDSDSAADVLIYVSDNESWVDRNYYRGTGMMTEWVAYKRKHPNAKLVCIDLTPTSHSQVKEEQDILRVGGFSDNVFSVISRFIEGGWQKDFWVKEIEQIELN